ncbi:hypothetical protein T12_6235, partial [Trichinella patagoniensis]
LINYQHEMKAANMHVQLTIGKLLLANEIAHLKLASFELLGLLTLENFQKDRCAMQITIAIKGALSLVRAQSFV